MSAHGSSGFVRNQELCTAPSLIPLGIFGADLWCAIPEQDARIVSSLVSLGYRLGRPFLPKGTASKARSQSECKFLRRWKTPAASCALTAVVNLLFRRCGGLVCDPIWPGPLDLVLASGPSAEERKTAVNFSASVLPSARDDAPSGGETWSGRRGLRS